MTCECCGDEGVECDIVQDEEMLFFIVVCKECIAYAKVRELNN